jgi:hypothetical protein
MGIAQSALLSNCSLRALLESSAISDSAENAGNELWIVHVAEPEEHLILLGKVEIQTGIKGIAVFKQFRGIGKIAEKRGTGRIGIQIQQLDGIRIEPPGGELIQAATS